MTDLADPLADLDDCFERPVVTRLPPLHPVDDVPPLSATVQYPPGRVPDLEDATAPTRVPRPRREPRVWLRSRVVAGLLGVFLGGLGLHRMYLGYWRRGLTMLALFVVGGFFTLGLATLAVCVVGFAEGLLYLSVRRGRFSRDARGRPLRG
ncbi:NINE protein [Cellulomonas sp. URHE0023]|uniref:NINE protein n=1 Tax=Cellulomonas sp. URHE0023 TaxID=1380354 RepID=UPI00068EB85C|nr:NINE protein [Cellulomonas sp. URHE0023]